MKLNLVSHRDAIKWIRQGFWLFKQNPLGFLMLVFMYVFFAQLAILIPVIGVFIVLLITPALSIGFMTACRQAIQKERILPTVYLAAFKLPSTMARKRVLQLGLIYTACILMLSFLASLMVDFEALLPLVTSDQPPSAEAMQQLYKMIFVGGALYIPVAMLMWFSPLLVAWADMPLMQAIFSSWMACWSNRAAFAYYIFIWSTALVALPMLIGSGLDAVGLGSIASYVVAPLSMAGLTVMHCSFFATWKGCFTDNNIEQLPS
ncbi:MAG: BPSS1780 family membrane protein [Polynucleobacter sp.]|nr:BPSS1780 family membrane protein [Polynucleobacter sp.]MDZ4056497.1 BPSS1780 family membrane protein [Polynucleobacter sp.]